MCDPQDTRFVVEVPPPMAGHAEFVIHRRRFDASVVAQSWAVGQQCQVGGNVQRRSLFWAQFW